MPLFIRKLRSQKRFYKVFGELYSNDSRAKHQHVHIIVLDALMRRIRIVANRRAYSQKLVRGNTRSNSAPADQNATLRSSIEHRPAHRFRKIRIVRWIFVECANIEHGVTQPA